MAEKIINLQIKSLSSELDKIDYYWNQLLIYDTRKIKTDQLINGNTPLETTFKSRCKSVEILAGSLDNSYQDGLKGQSKLNFPQQICMLNETNILIADRQNNRIRQLDLISNKLFTIAGSGKSDSLDNNEPINDPLEAHIFSPSSIAVLKYDSNTTILIGQEEIQFCLRELRINGPLSVLAGNMYVEKRLPATTVTTFAKEFVFSEISSLCVGKLSTDSNPKVFIPGIAGNCIRCYDPVTHQISILIEASKSIPTTTHYPLFDPYCCCIDNLGRLIIGCLEGRCLLRYDPLNPRDDNLLELIAGTYTVSGYSDGLSSVCGDISGCDCDENGTIYFSDYTHGTVRAVSSQGLVYTIVSPDSKYSTIPFNLYRPFSVVVDKYGFKNGNPALFISDFHRVIKISLEIKRTQPQLNRAKTLFSKAKSQLEHAPQIERTETTNIRRLSAELILQHNLPTSVIEARIKAEEEESLKLEEARKRKELNKNRFIKDKFKKEKELQIHAEKALLETEKLTKEIESKEKVSNEDDVLLLRKKEEELKLNISHEKSIKEQELNDIIEQEKIMKHEEDQLAIEKNLEEELEIAKLIIRENQIASYLKNDVGPGSLDSSTSQIALQCKLQKALSSLQTDRKSSANAEKLLDEIKVLLTSTDDLEEKSPSEENVDNLSEIIVDDQKLDSISKIDSIAGKIALRRVQSIRSEATSLNDSVSFREDLDIPIVPPNSVRIRNVSTPKSLQSPRTPRGNVKFSLAPSPNPEDLNEDSPVLVNRPSTPRRQATMVIREDMSSPRTKSAMPTSDEVIYMVSPRNVSLPISKPRITKTPSSRPLSPVKDDEPSLIKRNALIRHSTAACSIM